MLVLFGTEFSRERLYQKSVGVTCTCREERFRLRLTQRTTSGTVRKAADRRVTEKERVELDNLYEAKEDLGCQGKGYSTTTVNQTKLGARERAR